MKVGRALGVLVLSAAASAFPSPACALATVVAVERGAARFDRRAAAWLTSCPHAAAESLPRVVRMVQTTPALRSSSWNTRTVSGLGVLNESQPSALGTKSRD